MNLYYQTYGTNKNDWAVGIAGTINEINQIFTIIDNFGGATGGLVEKSNGFAYFTTTKEKLTIFFKNYFLSKLSNGNDEIGAARYSENKMNKIIKSVVV